MRQIENLIDLQNTKRANTTFLQNKAGAQAEQHNNSLIAGIEKSKN